MPTIGILALAMLVALAVAASAEATHASFLQLISTRYPTGAALPPDARRPTPALDFVDRSALPAGAVVKSAAKTNRGTVWVVTDMGSYVIAGGKATPLRLPTEMTTLQPQVNTDTVIRQVAADTDGQVWLATNAGLYVTDGDQWWQPIDRRDGVPYEDLNCVWLSPNGDVWAGAPQGAWRLRNGKFRYFWGKRWLPGNNVIAIWTDAKNNAWIETDGGTAYIEHRPMTLAEKAAYYDRITQERHNRRGWICRIFLKAPGDPSKGVIQHTEDNDSLWTAYYIGAMALRYAVTKDPVALRQARQSMNAVLDLERKSGIPGFPARSLITKDEIRAGVMGYNPRSLVHRLDEKEHPELREPIWYQSPRDPNLFCKGDTSSDSINGHCFAWYMYYRYCADAAEKKEIAAVVRRIMDYILKNDYRLIDHTGHQTRWGVWAPSYINDDPVWWGERALYPLEIISYLTTAYNITGDDKYLKARNDLIDKHHYLLNVLMHRRHDLQNWWMVNHSDDQLAFMVYYPLMMQEKDEARRRILTEMLARAWEPSVDGEITLREAHLAPYNFAYGGLTGNPCDPEGAIQDLRDAPWELYSWDAHNSQRTDAALRFHLGPGGRNLHDINRVVPADERAIGRLSDDPYDADAGTGGREESDTSPWLLAYWMGVYHGYIDPSE